MKTNTNRTTGINLSGQDLNLSASFLSLKPFWYTMAKNLETVQLQVNINTTDIPF